MPNSSDFQGFNISADDIALLAARGLKPIAGAQLPPINPSGGKSSTPTSVAPYTTTVGGITYYWDGSAWTPLSDPLQKILAGGSVSSVAQNYHLNPAELALEYAKLQNSLTTQQMSDLKDLITNRNTESVNLASVYDTAAKNAADFEQHPENAIADIAYRNAVFGTGQGATPYGSTANDPFQQRQQAMEDTFKQMFGPAADALKRAGEFVGSIPPSQYLSPPQTPSPAGVSTGGANGAGAGNPAPAAPVNTPPAPANPTVPQGSGPMGAPGPVPGMSHGGRVFDVPRPTLGDRLGAMTSTEGGMNINVHEPAVIMGLHTHRIYATLAEPRPDGTPRPEQVIVKPLPSELVKDRVYEARGKPPVSPPMAGHHMDQGGSITADPLGDPSVFIDQIRRSLALRGITTGANQALPDPRLLAGDAGTQLFDDPTMKGYITSAYSSLPGGGIKPDELDYTISRFRPAGIRPELPKVTF